MRNVSFGILGVNDLHPSVCQFCGMYLFPLDWLVHYQPTPINTPSTHGTANEVVVLCSFYESAVDFISLVAAISVLGGEI